MSNTLPQGRLRRSPAPWACFLLLVLPCTCAQVLDTKPSGTPQMTASLKGLGAQITPRATPAVRNGTALKVWAYSTDHTRLAPQMESIAWSQNVHNAFNYSILGQHGGQFELWHSKFKLLMEPLKSIPDDEIVLLVDGNDVILVQSFKLYNASVLLMAIAHQYPDYHKQPLFPALEPVTRQPFPSEAAAFVAKESRYINAGTVMGYAGALKYFLAQYFFRQGQVSHVVFDDQRFWTDLYLGQQMAGPSDRTPKIAVDNEGLISQVYHPTMRYELNAAEKAVVGLTSKDENLWGVNVLQRLYKHPACMLHSPGGHVNFGSLLGVVVPRYKSGQSPLWESTDSKEAQSRKHLRH